MTPLPEIPHVLRCTWNWRAPNGLTAANVIHFAGDGGSESDLWDSLDANMTAGLFDCQSTDAEIVSIDIIALDGTHATVSFPPPTHNIGNGNGDALAQVCALIKLTTPLRGASHRGRIFLPFVGESNVHSGLMDTASANNTTTAWVNFQTTMAADDHEIVVASYKLSDAFLVTGLGCEVVPATQRRRQDRLRA